MSNKTTNCIQILQKELKINKNLTEIENGLKVGQILFVKTNKFFENFQDDVLTLKDTIDRLKKICERRNSSMGRIGNDILVISPKKITKQY